MGYFGEETGKLGFGLMRLPRKGISIDVKQTSQMVDAFLESGFTYFDTAYVYPGSENATKKALVDRHPRESFTLASKLHTMVALNEKMAKQELDTSLSRLGTDYIDYYLLHSLMENNYKKYDVYHLWDFVAEEKRKGRIKHYGFSFHGSPELLDDLLNKHPDVEFVQLQLNYADWENKKITSRANYEVARKHGKSIVVMEPVKGGSLANPPKEVREIFDRVNPDASYASWAIRFVASLDGILTVLSGMSNIEQMKDNLSYMKNFQPLNDEEKKAIQQAMEIMGKTEAILCTACRYCTKGCPKQIEIPEIFEAMNLKTVQGQIQSANEKYKQVATEGHTPNDCIKCKKCEAACPQHILITEQLEKCAKAFE